MSRVELMRRFEVVVVVGGVGAVAFWLVAVFVTPPHDIADGVVALGMLASAEFYRRWRWGG
jgi:hypothetical protein